MVKETKASVGLNVLSTKAEKEVANVENVHIFSEDDDKDIQAGFTFKHTPPKEWTHVDDAMTRICSDMSARAYTSNSKDDFTFSRNSVNVEAVIYDDHGDLDPVLPKFAAAITGKTMILAWRGSSQLTNFISDANFPTVTSSKWGKTSKNTRVHGGFLTFVESDLNIHEEKLIQVIEEKGITELITTGHSLGGGIATIAHLAIEGQLQQEGNPWYDYKNKTSAEKEFVVKSVAFSAPMSIANMDFNDSKTITFLDQIAANSCNIIYAFDPVPHGFGNMSFIEDLVKNAIPQISTMATDAVPWVLGFATRFVDVEERLEKRFDALMKQKELQDVLPIMEKYHHYGNVIQYENDAAEPKKYKSYTDGKTGDDDFKNIKWQKSLHVIRDATVYHLCTVRGPGLSMFESVPDEFRTSRLHWLHEHSILIGKNNVGNPIPVDDWEDCLIKTKENLVLPSMGAVVEWEREPSNIPMQERKGTLYIKSDIPKQSENADLETDGGGFIFTSKLRATTFWRSSGLVDLQEGSDKIKGDDYGWD